MPGNAPAATRALAALRVLAAAPGPITAAALGRQLGIPRSSTYHLLAAMSGAGFVTHYPEEERWGLGVGAFEIGAAYLRHEPLERLGRPLLHRLAHDVASRAAVVAHLGVLHGRETLYLLRESPQTPVTVVVDVGVRLPAALTASGRAMLAELPAAQVRALFPSKDAFVDRTGVGPHLPDRAHAPARGRARAGLGRGGRLRHARLRLRGRRRARSFGPASGVDRANVPVGAGRRRDARGPCPFGQADGA